METKKQRWATRKPELYSLTFDEWRVRYQPDKPINQALEIYLGFMGDALQQGRYLDVLVLGDLVSHGLGWQVAVYLHQQSDKKLSTAYEKIFGDCSPIHISYKKRVSNRQSDKAFGNQLSVKSEKIKKSEFQNMQSDGDQRCYGR